MNHRVTLLFVALLLVAGVVSAQFESTAATWIQVSQDGSLERLVENAQADPELFRQKLGQFVLGLEGLNGVESADVTALGQRLTGLDTETLIDLRASTVGLANWERLPELMHNLERNREAGKARLIERIEKSRAQMASLADPKPTELEEFRQDYAFFVEALRAFAPLVDDPNFELQIDRIKEQIMEVSTEHLDRMRQNYYHNAPQWALRIENGVSGSLIPTIPTVGCSFGCPCDFGCPCTTICAFGSCSTICEPFCTAAEAVCNLACDGITAICSGLNSLINQINSVINSINSFIQGFVTKFTSIFNDIAALPSTIENFFLGLWNQIKAGLEAAFDAFLGLLPEPEEVLDFLLQPVGGISAVSSPGFWTDFAEGFFQGATLSVDCGLIGLGMGANVPGFGEVGSARAEWVCKRGLDHTDDLIWDVIPDDVKGTPVKLPYALLVHYPIKFFCKCLESQSALSFDQAQAAHRSLAATVLDQEVDTVARQSSLSFLDTDTAQLANPQISTVQGAVNLADSQTADLDSDVQVVSGQVDDVDAALEAQGDQVAQMEALTLRIRIEENLTRGSSSVVGLFQTPESIAGYLTTVRAIVQETIDNTSSANLEIFDALAYLQQGDSLVSEGFYEKAYESYQKAYQQAVQETP